MPGRADILDQRETLGRPLLGSLLLHVTIFAVVIATPLVSGLRKREPWGDPNAGGAGSMAVNVVNRVPLPERKGPANPLANPTEAMVPAAPPKAKEQRKTAPPAPDAVPIPSKAKPRRPAPQTASTNTWRAQQKDSPNQMHSTTGQGLVSPMVGQTGSGGVGFGPGSAFGTRFAWYSNLLREAVARKWNTADVDPRISTAPPVIVSFSIRRDGSVRNVRVAQRSGIPLLDASAQRAIFEAAPFPPLPAEHGGSEATIEFWFHLSR